MEEHIFSHIKLEDTYVEQVFTHYWQCFLKSKKYRLLLASNNLISTAHRNHIEVGVCSRTLGLQLPGSRTFEGGAIRGKLHQKGLLTRLGGELFRGCFVFPERDEQGRIVSATGYRFGRVRPWQEPVISWAVPLTANGHSGMDLIRELAYA